MKKLRFLLGDQLNHKHSWFSSADKNTIYFMAEMRQETDYTVHHIQKVVAFFASMRNFYEHLKSKGHQVIYYEIDAEENKQDLLENLQQLIDKYEKVNRNFYGGAIGYIDFKGNFNHAIIIRSFLSQNNILNYQAGAGIVIDSQPEKELQEVYNKLGALDKALKNAELIK